MNDERRNGAVGEPRPLPTARGNADEPEGNRERRAMETIEIYTDRKMAKARVAELGFGWYEAHGVAAICVTIRPEDELDCTETRMAAKQGIDIGTQNIYCVYPDRANRKGEK